MLSLSVEKDHVTTVLLFFTLPADYHYLCFINWAENRLSSLRNGRIYPRIIPDEKPLGVLSRHVEDLDRIERFIAPNSAAKDVQLVIEGAAAVGVAGHFEGGGLLRPLLVKQVELENRSLDGVYCATASDVESPVSIVNDGESDPILCYCGKVRLLDRCLPL